MTSSLALGLVFALVSAGALNWGFFTQQGAAATLPRLSLRRPIHSLALLFGNTRWLIGFVTGLAGWALYVTALALAPLSLVQAVSAGGIGLLALLVWRASGVRPPDREVAGAGLAVAGLVLLGLSLNGESGLGSTAAGGTIVLWIVGSLLAAGVAIGARGASLAPGAGFGAAAGILYAAGDVVTKAAVGGGAALLFVPAVFALHGLAFVAVQFGFQRGGALQTAGVATLLTNALPIAAGALVFGEPIPSGPAGVGRILAFACVVAGAAFLTRAPGHEDRRRLGSVRWRVGSRRFGAPRPGSTASGSPSSTRPTT